jgi:hypothetical protein
MTLAQPLPSSPGGGLSIFCDWNRRLLRAQGDVRQRRHEGEHLHIDMGPILLDGPGPLPVGAGEAEQRPLTLAFQCEPMPARGLALVGLAEGGGWDQAAPTGEAITAVRSESMPGSY